LDLVVERELFLKNWTRNWIPGSIYMWDWNQNWSQKIEKKLEVGLIRAQLLVNHHSNSGYVELEQNWV
jgi:hypothetical protein